MTRTLNIQVEHHDPITIVGLGGYMAQLEVYKLKAQIERLINNESCRLLIFDLTPLVFIDSAGIGVLMHARAECMRVNGQAVLVRSAAPQVSQALNSATLFKVIEMFDDTEAALAFLRNKHGLPDDKAPEAPQTEPTELLRLLDIRLSRLEQRMVAIEQKLNEKP